jgi:hypothetical protein
VQTPFAVHEDEPGDVVVSGHEIEVDDAISAGSEPGDRIQ